MKLTQNKKAAMELSVGTMVTIVLLVMVLILGIVLIQNIFKGAKGAVDLTNDQIRDELNKLFSEEKKVVIYPGTKRVEIKHEDIDGVGIGIRNLLSDASGSNKFSYDVTIVEAEKCGGETSVAKWFNVGKSDKNIPIAIGEMYAAKVLFQIPTGTPLCTARFRANIEVDGKSYATDFFDITVKA